MLPAYRRQRSGVQIPPWVTVFFLFILYLVYLQGKSKENAQMKMLHKFIFSLVYIRGEMG